MAVALQLTPAATCSDENSGGAGGLAGQGRYGKPGKQRWSGCPTGAARIYCLRVFANQQLRQGKRLRGFVPINGDGQ